MATSKGRSSQLSGVWVCRTLTLIAGLPAWNAGSLGRSHRMAKVAGAITRSDQPFGLRATSSAASHPHRALPAGPTGAASPPCSRTWPRSRRSPPIASHSRQHDPTPAERPAPATLLNTDPVFPDAPSLHPLESWSLRQTRRGSVAPKCIHLKRVLICKKIHAKIASSEVKNNKRRFVSEGFLNARRRNQHYVGGCGGT